MDTESVYFTKLRPDAIIPKRGTEVSAGFDLYAAEDTLIVGGAGNFLVPTGVAVKLPKGTYGRIAMRSGLALNQHLTVSAGVIDVDYSGPIGVLVSSTKIFDIKDLGISVFHDEAKTPLKLDDVNSSDTSIVKAGLDTVEANKEIVRPSITLHMYLIKKGERFAQLVVERVCYAPGIEVRLIEKEGKEHIGFGSTGKS